MPSSRRVLVASTAVIVLGAVAAVLTSSHAGGAGEVALALVGSVALGVGSSLLASALVARAIATQVFGLDVTRAVEALRGYSPFSRADQRLAITLDLAGDSVRITAVHDFAVRHSSGRTAWRPFHLFTDLAGWSFEGGFESVRGPDNIELRGHDALQPYLRTIHGKVRFTKAFWFPAREAAHFSIITYGVYRLHDRLIWTVEHISSDFQVVIENRTGLQGPIDIKINHHRETEIAAHVEESRRDGIDVRTFDFFGEVLPFQGFELQWDL